MPPETIATYLNEALSALQRATVAFADVEADSGQTLQLALHHLIEVTGADAGAIAVPGEHEGPAVLLAEQAMLGAGAVSKSILEATLAEVSAQAAITEPPASTSAHASGITSILCTPVRRRGKTLAAVYLDRRDRPAFDEVALRLATAFAAVLGLAFDLTRQREWAEQATAEARAVAVHTSDFWRFGSVVTRNPLFAACLQRAERSAHSEATVLLLGETGVGKEHLARCIHTESARRSGPFIVFNCAAIPDTLLESELFGHERGAFTGAVQTRRGKFELAEHGTLFFDEIGELPLHLQPKLLRVLEDRQVTRVGGTQERHADVRIMVATHRDLASEVRTGQFREDLYYRLNVVALTLPPLRKRIEDIPSLARGFLQLESQRSGRELSLSEEALRALSLYRWPGNVRELRNVIERLCALSDGPEIGVEDIELSVDPHGEAESWPARPVARDEISGRLDEAERAIRDLRVDLAGGAGFEDPSAPAAVPAAGAPEALRPGNGPADPDPSKTFREQMDDAARQVISRTLRQWGSISAAARALGMSRQQVYLKCKKLGLEDF
jgi:transcriptional regulator with GAF, ATPase, and Fis domain